MMDMAGGLGISIHEASNMLIAAGYSPSTVLYVDDFVRVMSVAEGGPAQQASPPHPGGALSRYPSYPHASVERQQPAFGGYSHGHHHTQASTRHGIPDDVAQEFKAVDRDGDGWVTALDCAAAMVELGYDMSISQALGIFKEANCPADGRFDVTTFARLRELLIERYPNGPHGSRVRTTQNLHERHSTVASASHGVDQSVQAPSHYGHNGTHSNGTYQSSHHDQRQASEPYRGRTSEPPRTFGPEMHSVATSVDRRMVGTYQAPSQVNAYSNGTMPSLDTVASSGPAYRPSAGTSQRPNPSYGHYPSEGNGTYQSSHRYDSNGYGTQRSGTQTSSWQDPHLLIPTVPSEAGTSRTGPIPTLEQGSRPSTNMPAPPLTNAGTLVRTEEPWANAGKGFLYKKVAERPQDMFFVEGGIRDAMAKFPADHAVVCTYSATQNSHVLVRRK
eukprot:EG_transcript_6912